MNFKFDYNSFISAIIGGGLTIVATWITFYHENKKSLREKENENKELHNKFFMELNYNKRKIIYTIENENYRLTGLDNLHWKNFVYSEASHILLKDKTLVDDLATLDSMIDQANDLIQSIKETETARLCNIGHTVIDSGAINIMRASLRKYAKNELRPQIERAIVKLEKLSH